MKPFNRETLSPIRMRGMILLITAILICFTHSVSGEILRNHFEYDGFRRNYILFRPQNVQANMPVILCLHGGTEDADFIMNYTVMNSVADTAGFMAVYPEGISGDWTCGWIYDNPDIDDVGYISALIDTLKAHYDIDMNRIYCCGFSEGARMTYELVSQIGHQLAAVGGVGGPINESTISHFKPFRPFPVILCYGKEDRQKGEITLDFWLNYNQCPLKADTVSFPDIVPDDNCTVEKISFTNCADETSILFYNVINGGHHWPGGTQDWWSYNLNKDISFSSEVWNFFKNYQNPISTDIAYGKTIDIFPAYIPSEGDTLKVKTQLVNPQNHPVIVHALIQSNESAYQDSVALFDDGLHGDGDATDGHWGNETWMSGLPEDMYTVDVITRDLTEGTVHYVPILSHFTTIGPIVYVSHSFYKTDTEPNPGDAIRIYVTLSNEGSTATATDLRVELSCTDTRVEFTVDGRDYNDIEPGEMVQNKYTYSFNIPEDWPVNTEIPMTIHISSHGTEVWTDTFSVMVLPPSTGIQTLDASVPKQFALYSNYPNPFNPSTTIRFDLPESGEVSLKVFTLLGEEVETLLNRKLSAGKHHVIWYAENQPSGVYLFRLEAGGFVQIRKMILMK
jgi:polyhydroxybutyrate depolymerase